VGRAAWPWSVGGSLAPDGQIALLKLTRGIEMASHRSGATRTGRYRVRKGPEDGFVPGP
jgi:hypothetical protein